MARTDYGAILSTVIKDTSDAIREVNDTSALIAPNAWGTNIRTMHSDADYENALSYIPTKTVSGAIASFNDGAGGLDLKSLKVAITAKQSGSGDPSPDNIRPISGWSECNVVRCGKNVWSYGDVSGTKRVAVTVDIKAGTYTISSNVTSSDTDYDYNLMLFYYEDNTTESVYIDRGTRQNVTFTLSKNVKSINFYASRSNNASDNDTFSFTDIQLEVGSSATSYEAYSADTYTIQLGDTYYGGSLDVTTGVLTVDKVVVDMSTLSWSTTSWGAYRASLSDSLNYSASNLADAITEKYAVTTYANLNQNKPNNNFALYNKNVYVVADASPTGQLVYPLETPITVQLTPTQVEQLLVNNVWADTGDITECEYYTTASGVQSVEGAYERADASGVSSVPVLLYTYTATEDCTMCFCGTITTNTSQSQGFLKMVVNDDVSYRTLGVPDYTETPFSFDNMSLQSGDTVKFYVDWEGTHSNCYFNLRLSMVKAV